VLAGNIAGAATDAWTAAQVDSRREASLAELMSEWDDVGPRFAAMIDDFPGRYGRQVAADITVHEQDIRGALARPGARQSESLRRALDFLLSTTADVSAVALGLGPLEVRGGEDVWVIGTGQPAAGDAEAAVAAAMLSTDVPPRPDVEPVVTVIADPFELFRAFTGRRSADQIRGFDWIGDPTPYLVLFGQPPFTLRAVPLHE
jgi:hypothetical protein